MTARAAIILAAGQGTRMKSSLPKVLHPVGGRAMLDHAIDAAEALGCERIVVVVGDHSPSVRAHVVARLGEGAVAVQDPPLGTAHAVRAAEAALAGFEGEVIVTYGDTPLLKASDIAVAFGGEGVTVVGFEARDPTGYGRLLLDADGGLEAIVEHKEATPDQLTVTTCNSGVMAASASLMFSLLAEVRNENSKGEYYLTDVVELARARGAATRAVMANEDAVMGVNAQGELAQAEALFQSIQRDAAMARGVHMPAPDTVHFSWDTEIEGGVTVEPYVVFGPGVTLASGARIRAFSHIEGATVGADAQVGPYARLRPGAVLGAHVHVGNFVEVKNVEMGPGSKANHLTYLGDGSVGPRANIGAGTIFCNYDGFFKYRTEVGEGALIGSNTALVAPVRVGANAMTGSGAVITEDVPDGALAIARAKQVTKPGWAQEFIEMMRARKMAAGK
ncbi:bifunctional N-acetylglucosamine-1-phosphate uridyltransferase/glucosamine-1-phosphate acetyltransferase [Brevundimonas sp. Leaf363]|uniref:bifunctional UDP-N-acetylglucosamine diphosphorylase/glucosamine-1-phosphate N-acetyltransferase GlmU n=1 Tax=Brevundimonas sp. Leaf363 TaxID=1736353 RepID=UPI0006F40A50|nr:bifunctional UDP-N-acetylglucosamine diphosphorylase/glucosamine-1-phosphate N-acetyltransferase GlmU [Brevundimonas sp. Leaf363]KQS54290.1 bifunctional N-acetylglucosamine-1-phosphate uridyltransferase/glucosamine-1-phosphate acetyltransferase [Brevundimonas sp. Leaf363]